MRTRTRFAAAGTSIAVLGVTAIVAAPSMAQTSYPIPNPNQPTTRPDGTVVVSPGATNVTVPANASKVEVTATAPLTITGGAANLTVKVIATAPVTFDLPPGSKNITATGTAPITVKFEDKGGSSITTGGGDDDVELEGTGAGTGKSEISLGGGRNNVELPAGTATRANGAGFISYVVKTLEGRDVIKGGNGKLSAYAGNGNDVITGGAGGGRFSGQGGNDTIKGGTGEASIYGGAGNDKLYATKAKSTLSGGAGNDYTSSVNGFVDTVSGGGGKDRARAGKRDKVARSVESVKRSAKN